MPSFEYKAQITRVVDGDTLDADVDLGFHVHKRVRLRLLGVDTPEVYGVKKDSEEYNAGVSASAFVGKWLAEAPDWLLIRTHKDKQGKYGRWLAEVINPSTGEMLNEALRVAGHSV